MNTVDLTKLDEEIRKLQELRRLASDPSLARFFITSNGHNRTAVTSNEESATGSVSGTVLEICRSLDGEFTIREVLAGMNARGFDFAGSNPQRAVGNALKRLTGKHQIKVVRESSGRSPVVYVNS